MSRVPFAACLLLFSSMAASVMPAGAEPVTSLKVTVLSTMLAGDLNQGLGEWGFAALVEVDGRRILLDTGQRAETVQKNAAELGLDLSTATDLIITHNHGDHTGGLLTLRRDLMKKNPQALSRVHVGVGVFYPRPGTNGREGNGLLPLRKDYEATGGTFVEHNGPVQLMPGVWLTGPVPRVHPERNWSGSGQMQTPKGLVEDTVPEDSSLVIETAEGLVLVSGCGHAGMINTMEHVRKAIRPAPIVTAIGGFHLFAATDAALDWTAGKLKEFGLRQLLGAHCTGIEAVFRLRERAGLTRQTAVVGAVGASYTSGKGIDPRALAR